MTYLRPSLLGLLLVPALAAPAGARNEDLKRQIEAEQAAAADLERLDERHAAASETTLLKSWLDEAWGSYSKEEYDSVRVLMERVLAQAELIRQKISASKLLAQAAEREATLKASRDKVGRTQKALQDAAVKKRALEMTTR
jgi:hypothetical protein